MSSVVAVLTSIPPTTWCVDIQVLYRVPFHVVPNTRRITVVRFAGGECAVQTNVKITAMQIRHSDVHGSCWLVHGILCGVLHESSAM